MIKLAHPQEKEIDKFVDELIDSILSELEKGKNWVITDDKGYIIARYSDEAQAIKDCIDRNVRAEELGVKARYRLKLEEK